MLLFPNKLTAQENKIVENYNLLATSNNNHYFLYSAVNKTTGQTELYLYDTINRSLKKIGLTPELKPLNGFSILRLSRLVLATIIITSS